MVDVFWGAEGSVQSAVFFAESLTVPISGDFLDVASGIMDQESLSGMIADVKGIPNRSPHE